MSDWNEPYDPKFAHTFKVKAQPGENVRFITDEEHYTLFESLIKGSFAAASDVRTRQRGFVCLADQNGEFESMMRDSQRVMEAALAY